MAMTSMIRWILPMFAIASHVDAIAAVPHQFQSGTPARAADVNANFSSIDGRITELETESVSQQASIAELEHQQTEQASELANQQDQISTIQGDVTALQSAPPPFQILDSSGAVVGDSLTLFINPMSALALLAVPTPWGEERITVRISNRFLLQADNSYPPVIYYSSADCSGDGFITDFTTESWFGGMTPYILDTNPGPNGVYANLIVADTTQPSFDLTAYSRRQLLGSCESFPAGNVFRVFPAAVIGDLHATWPPPYSIRFR